MRILASAALAATVLAAAATGAGAEDCTLKQMASLDMTMLADGRFAVPVSVNGTAFKFMVDTGGIFTQIGAREAQKAGLQEAQSHNSLYGVAGKLQMGAANARSFMVGNNEAKNFHIGVVHSQDDAAKGNPSKDASPKPEGAGEGDEIGGILAPDFLSLFDIELDFAAKKMNLFSPDHCPGKVVYWTRGGYAELPFRFTGGAISVSSHIELRMTLDGTEIETDLDTGSGYSWLNKKTAFKYFGVGETSPGVVKSPYARNDFPILRKQFGSLGLGGLAVQNPQVEILPVSEDDAFRMEHSEKSRDDPIYGFHLDTEKFILGMNVLSKLHLYIGYKEHTIYLTAADAH